MKLYEVMREFVAEAEARVDAANRRFGREPNGEAARRLDEAQGGLNSLRELEAAMRREGML